MTTLIVPRPRRRPAALLTGACSGMALVALSAVPAGAALPSAPTAPTASTAAAAAKAPAAVSKHSVPLITGDVVTVSNAPDGRSTIELTPAPGSSGGAQTQTIGKDTYVFPDEALPYLASGKLDHALFNVSKLIDQGYANGAASLPLIVTYAAGPGTAAKAPAPVGTRKTRVLESINGVALSATSSSLDELWDATAPAPAAASRTTARFASGIDKIWLDGKVKADLADSVPQVGAPTAWAAGFDGTGATVAVLDSGIDANHPDIDQSLREATSFVPGDDAGDSHGHGTHVASTVIGSGEASGGANKGVAPGADLIVGKVLDDDGSGLNSWIIDGMEWASTRADVVNMSLGSYEASDGTDPMAMAVNRLSAQTGALFVIAAGNSYGEYTIGSPGAADAALTVAAVDGDDNRADFSSMGPRLGDDALKPDISAPGVDVTAARAADSPGEGSYVSFNGTSMATPHVAGAAAILAAKRPDWSGQQLKDALMSSAKGLAGTTAYQVGTGRLDVPASLRDVTATGSAYLGQVHWPHDGDEPLVKTITYSNSGAAPVMLGLTGQLRDGEGQPVDGLLSLSTGEVTVPAGGTASVTISADPDDVASSGRFTGEVVATDAATAVSLRTAVGMVKESERYDLDVSALGRDGRPAGGFLTLYRYGDVFVTTLAIDPVSGRVPTQRLEPGAYNVTTWLPVKGKEGRDSAGVALLGTPHLQLDSDKQLVLDARTANEISARTTFASEDRARIPAYYHDSGIGGQFAAFANRYQVSPAVDTLYAAPTGPVPGATYDFKTRWLKTVPLLDLAAYGRTRTPLHPLYQGGTKRLSSGKVRLEAVYAGAGAEQDYAGLNAAGKAVLITRSDGVDAFTRAEAADEAGAALLVIVNDGPGKLFEYAGGTNVPVVSLTRAEGAGLVAQAQSRRLRIQGTAVEFSPYLYDLVDGHAGQIPRDLTFAPTQAQLARIDQRFLGGQPNRLILHERADCRAWYWPPCNVVREPAATQSARVDYVSTQAGTEWYQGAFALPSWEQRHDRVAYRPGQRVSIDWFAPIVRPVTGPGYWLPHSNGRFFAVNVPYAGGSHGITGTIDAGTIVSRLYAKGQLVKESPSQAIQTDVPLNPGWARYRFEQETTRPATPWVTSTSTSTRWDFRAKAPEEFADVDTILPLLQLDYAVATDLAGTVKAGQKGTITLTPKHHEGAAGAGRVSGATLLLSYNDGRTWQQVTLTRQGAKWVGEVRYPSSAKHVSLRASATDTLGNAIQQTVIRAYGVR